MVGVFPGHQSAVRTEKLCFDLLAAFVIAPMNPRGAKALSRRRFAMGAEVSFLDLVTVLVVTTRDARGAQTFALDGLAACVEISFDDLDEMWGGWSLF